MIRAWFACALVVLTLTACAGRQKSTQMPVENSGPVAEPLAVEASVEKPAAEEPRKMTDEEVMYHVFAAELLGTEGDLEGAVGQYLEAAMKSEDPEIARRATRVAFAAQSWLHAAMAADRWALLAPESVPAHESAAAALLMNGDYAGAELQIRQIIDLLGDSSEAWDLVSSLLAQSGSPERASLILENVLADQGSVDNADALFVQSQLAVRAGNLDRAYELAQQAVALDSQNVRFLTWVTRIAMNLGDTQSGLRYIEQAWQQDPEDHDLALAYADLLARTGDPEASREVMKNMPQSPDVMLSRILFELSSGDREAAQALYSEFSETDYSGEGDKAFYQAQAAEALGDIDQAIELYGNVQAGDNAVAATILRAELLAGKGDIDGARQELQKLRSDSDPGIVEQSWLAESRILRLVRDREAALQVLDQAIEQAPDSIAIRYARALLAAELGWVDVAESDLRIIISEQPENAAALNALGYTLADQTERYEEAEALIRQAFILQPDEASIVDSMGWIAYRLGRLEESEKFLAKAWEMEKNAEIAAHLGEVQWMLGKQDAARATWRDGLEADGDNPVLLETIRRLDVAP